MRWRKWLQAIVYEIGAVLLVTPFISYGFEQDVMSSVGLSVVMSVIAVLWNYLFNTLFEIWESRQVVRGRSWRRRLVHAIGFEGGLTLLFVPLLMYWLSVSWWVALLTDVSLLIVFLVYTFVFTWIFDRVLGLPVSAQ